MYSSVLNGKQPLVGNAAELLKEELGKTIVHENILMNSEKVEPHAK